MKAQAFSAIRWTTASTALIAIVQIIQVAILARILGPAEYGLMAMASVVLGLAELFAEMGLNSAFMQRQNVTDEQRSSLFWANLTSSVCVAVVVVATSSLIADHVFNDPTVALVLCASAPIFMIVALGAQVRVSAEKALNFRPLAFIDIGCALVGFVMAVALALLDWGVYALVASALIAATVRTALSWKFLSKGWAPTSRLRFAEVQPFLKFGGALVSNNLVNQVNASLDLLLGGSLLGAGQLGLYSIPRNFVLQIQFAINPIVTRVGFPLIARMQGDISRVRSIYLQSIAMTTATNAPIYVALAIFAPEIISILLGAKWDGAVDLLRVLALWGGVRSIGNPVGSLLLGMGRADLSLKWNVIVLFFVFPLLWFGSQFGALGLSVSLLVLVIGMYLPMWFFLVKPLCNAHLAEYSLAALRPFVISAIAIGPTYWLRWVIEDDYALLLSAFLMGSTAYMFLSYLLNKSWYDSLLQLLRGSNSP